MLPGINPDDVGPVTLAPQEELLKIARWAITRDDDWDMFPEFVTLHWDAENEKVGLGTVAIFAGDIPPESYPQAMMAMAVGDVGKAPATTAYLFVIEGYGVIPPKADASQEEKDQFEHDRINRGFHARDDKFEVKMALVADITGKTWMVTKYREDGKVVDSTEDEGLKSLGGRMPDAVQRIALATGKMYELAGAWDGTDPREEVK